MNKKSLSERDICTKFITPAVEKAEWDKQTQLLEKVYSTDGKITGHRKHRGHQNPVHPPNSELSSITKIIKVFGSRMAYNNAIKELENELYKIA